MSATIKIRDEDREGLTLAAVEEMCEQARAGGATGPERFTATVSWRGKLTSVELAVDITPVTIDTGEDKDSGR